MMTIMYKAAVMAALACSILGYGALYRRLRLPICFFPVTLVAGVSVVLYGFGFFSALKIGCYAILLGGMALLVLCRKQLNLRAFLCDWSILLCIAAGAWLYIITREATLSHWDDGSHWYRICKALYAEGAFPTTPDILYYNYVPGCQLWVYFVLRFIDFSTSNCMFAQGLINIACVASLFAGMNEMKTRMEKGFSLATVALAAVTLCCMNVGTYALLVDLQLGLTAMALLILMLDQGNRREAIVPAAIVFAFLLLIKNSAVFFAPMVFIWAAIRHRWRGAKLFKRLIGCVGVPLAVRYAYTVRAGIVYAGAAASPQTMSLSSFAQMLALKDEKTVGIFTGRFFSKLIIGDTGLSATVYVCILLLVLLFVCLRYEKMEKEAAAVRENLIIGVVMLAAYAAMLYCTYMFTMTANEAISVNSFYRYYGSMVIVFAGMTIYTGMSLAESTWLGGEGAQRIYVLSLMLFAVLAMPGAYPKRYIWGQGKFEMPDYYGPTFWQTMEYFIPQNRHYTDQHYVVFWDPLDFQDGISDDLYAQYAVEAWVRSDHVDVISLGEIEEGLTQEQIDALADCDHLVFMSDLTDERELLSPYLDMTDLTVGQRSR